MGDLFFMISSDGGCMQFIIFKFVEVKLRRKKNFKSIFKKLGKKSVNRSNIEKVEQIL